MNSTYIRVLGKIEKKRVERRESGKYFTSCIFHAVYCNHHYYVYHFLLRRENLPTHLSSFSLSLWISSRLRVKIHERKVSVTIFFDSQRLFYVFFNFFIPFYASLLSFSLLHRFSHTKYFFFRLTVVCVPDSDVRITEYENRFSFSPLFLHNRK